MVRQIRSVQETRESRQPILSESMNYSLRVPGLKFFSFGWLHKLGIPSTRYRLGMSGTYYFSREKERDEAAKYVEANRREYS